MTITERYGCTLRMYDNGGKTFDRYTCIPPRWAHQHRERRSHFVFETIGASELPYHPQGFGMCVSAEPGPHLGKRIHWDQLPPQVQQFARESFTEYCPETQP